MRQLDAERSTYWQPMTVFPWSSWPAASRRDVWAAVERACPHRDTERDARQVCGMIDVYSWVGPGMLSPWDPRFRRVEPFSARDVRRYATRMRKGEVPPAVMLAFDKFDGRDRLFILDGAHRIAAARRAGLEAIPAFVGGLPGRLRGRAARGTREVEGAEEEAKKHNRRKALRLSPDELLDAARRMFGITTDVAAARRVGSETISAFVGGLPGRLRGQAARGTREVEGAEEEAKKQNRRKALRLSPDELLDAARRMFGITTDVAVAGFVLPGGELLDFSGGSSGGRDGRWSDHREIAQVHDDLPGGMEGMVLFMERTGAIRMGAVDHHLWVHLEAPPTAAQVSALADVVARWPAKSVEVLGGGLGQRPVELEWPSSAQLAGALRKAGSGRAGLLRRGQGRGNATSQIVWTTSPLDYGGRKPRRLQFVDLEFGPASAGAVYFAPTERVERRSPRTGRVYKKSRRVPVPGADLGVVGFLDFDLLPTIGVGNLVHIYYMAVRPDARGFGIGSALVAALYDRFARADRFEWGEIHHDAAAKLFREYEVKGKRGEVPATYGKVRV